MWCQVNHMTDLLPLSTRYISFSALLIPSDIPTFPSMLSAMYLGMSSLASSTRYLTLLALSFSLSFTMAK